MNASRSSFAALALIALLASSEASASIMQMVVFGDSLSDSGNLYNLTGIPTSPPYDQRFSNGPVAVEYLASSLGVLLTPSTVGGTNYAWAGAATGYVTTASGAYDSYVAYAYPQASGLNGLTGMQQQVADYIGGTPSSLANTLFVLWGGANDAFISADPLTMSNAVVNLGNEINALIGVGATRFLIPNMADLSLTPEGQTYDAVTRAYLSNLTDGFNSALASALLGIKANNPAVDLVGFDTNALFKEVFNDPAAYGFTNNTTACLYDAGCSNPDQYMFWDSSHPTTRLNQILGNAFFAATVPEPDSWLLLLGGLLPMFWVRRLVARPQAMAAA